MNIERKQKKSYKFKLTTFLRYMQQKIIMSNKSNANSTDRVKKYRSNLRASGLRPVQIWVPDTRSDKFQQECIRQSLIISTSDATDNNLSDFLNENLNNIEGWTE